VFLLYSLIAFGLFIIPALPLFPLLGFRRVICPLLLVCIIDN
jgi:hypothetical protein